MGTKKSSSNIYVLYLYVQGSNFSKQFLDDYSEQILENIGNLFVAWPERTPSMYALTLSLDGDLSVAEECGRVTSIPSS